MGEEKLCELFSFVRGKSYTSKELSDEGTIMVNLKIFSLLAVINLMLKAFHRNIQGRTNLDERRFDYGRYRYDPRKAFGRKRRSYS